MILNNWKNSFRAMMTHTVITNGIKRTNGNVADAGWYSGVEFGKYMFGASQVAKGTSTAGFVIGSGNTPVSLDDYELDTMLTSGFDATISYSDGYTIIVITNTTNSDLTIRECGIQQTLPYREAQSSTYLCLCERTVLTQPLVIAPGDTGQIRYEFTINI